MKTREIDGTRYRVVLVDSEQWTVCEFCRFYSEGSCPEVDGALACTEYDEGKAMAVFINDTPESIAAFIARRLV